MEDKYLTVTQINRYIKFKLDQDVNLQNVFLKGEISNFKAHSRGHLYFTLKDENARINAVMFQGNAKNLKFTPIDGMKVLVVGKISVYEASGAYQIYVEEMLEDGIGNLYIEFEKLKKKLEQEGLFDPKHKKPIPKVPKKIGVVTAPTGAAIKDILTTIKRRWPIAEVYLFPSLVQGENAKEDIVKQIQRASSYPLDTLIVGRGGGSIEDLWSFNEEMVARAIYECPIPVISAVGHEIDFTIADFVADLRAPTPTAAAELAVPSQLDFDRHLEQLFLRLKKTMHSKIEFLKNNLKHLESNYIFENPMNIYYVKEEKFDRTLEQLKYVFQRKINLEKEKFQKSKDSYILKNPTLLYKEKKQNLEILENRFKNIIVEYPKNKKQNFSKILAQLEILNPLLTIQRGYAIARSKNQIISSATSLLKGDILEIEFKDGKIESKVL